MSRIDRVPMSRRLLARRMMLAPGQCRVLNRMPMMWPAIAMERMYMGKVFEAGMRRAHFRNTSLIPGLTSALLPVAFSSDIVAPNKRHWHKDQSQHHGDKEPGPARTSTSQHDPAQNEDNGVVADEHQSEQECNAVDHFAATVLRYAVL